MFCDIAVVGGGTAACAAALTLHGGQRSVVMIAPETGDDDRPGESLSAGADRLLKELGVTREFAAVPQRLSHTVYSSWGSSLLAQRASIAQPDGMGYVIDRRAFDRTLAQAVEARGMRVVRDIVREANCATDDRWHLRLRGGDEITARFVIDCTGRSAVIARRMTYRAQADRLVAAYTFLSSCDESVEPTSATLIEAVSDGWWYATLLPDRRMSVAFFTDAGTLPKRMRSDASAWLDLVERTQFIRRWMQSAGYDCARVPRVATAATTWLESIYGPVWAAAGDAAAAFDPLSSYGLVSALWSGRRAALGAVAALNGDYRQLEEYAAALKDAIKTTLSQRARIYAQERRFGTAPFWLNARRVQAESVEHVLHG